MPQDLLDALPPREQLALTKQAIPVDPEVAKANIKRIHKMLSGRDMAAEEAAT